MASVRDTPFYNNVIKELKYPFATIFLFDGFIVSEINQGVVYSWDDHAELVSQDIANYYGTDGQDLILISNRINSYSVVAADWLKFFKHNYKLKGYAVVGYNKASLLNTLIENLFFNDKIKKFNDLSTAINWVENSDLEAAAV